MTCRCDLAGISTFGCGLWCVACFSVAGSPIFDFKTRDAAIISPPR